MRIFVKLKGDLSFNVKIDFCCGLDDFLGIHLFCYHYNCILWSSTRGVARRGRLQLLIDKKKKTKKKKKKKKKKRKRKNEKEKEKENAKEKQKARKIKKIKK